MFALGLLLGSGLTLFLLPQIGSGNSTGNLCAGQTVTIGALNDLSSDLSSQGKGDLAAELLAIQDVNSYERAGGCNVTFKLDAQDFRLDNTVALTELQAMNALGIQVVIGPPNSGTIQSILSYATENHIVLISPSSTSPALTGASNFLFRTAPNDAAQGQADARMMIDRGARAVVIVNRDDTYGGGLGNATVSFLKADGVPAVDIQGPFKYDPTATDFSALITQITSAYNSLNTGSNTGHVAIFCISFEELGSILQQAKEISPSLLNTSEPWFGTDGVAEDSKLANTTSGVGQLTAQVRLTATVFGLVNNSKTLDFIRRVQGTPQGAALLGGDHFYIFEGYDDVWIAALSIIAVGLNDGSQIAGIIPYVAGNFYGLTGWEGLTGYHDRIPGSYQIWKVSSSGAQVSWVPAGIWDYASDTVNWSNPP
ncbi:MAG TPA: ABC transporter substrate-binding protein [Nitrososphaerales archaeon]|nr:ABC transporter substrate-binding protein [Nitrososphaerales archaeon]